MDTTPEPPADAEIEATTMHEPALRKGYEPNIAAELELPEASEKGCEPATLCDVLGALLDFEGMEEDPAHTTTAEGETLLTSAVNFYDELEMEFYLDLPTPIVIFGKKSPVLKLVPPSSDSPVLHLCWFCPAQNTGSTQFRVSCPAPPLILPSTNSPASLEFPPSLLLPSPLQPRLGSSHS